MPKGTLRLQLALNGDEAVAVCASLKHHADMLHRHRVTAAPGERLAVEQEIMRLGRALGKFEQAVVAALLGAPAGPSTGASGRTQDERSPGPRSGTPRATPRTED